MALTWLHLSDFHIREDDGYDRNEVLDALVRSAARGRRPDVVFATGDIGFSGKPGEYALASAFFDALLDAVGLDRSRLFVIAGNHDVDRALGVGLGRSLASREQADQYFAPAAPRPHLTQKQVAFLAWYADYFDGVRAVPTTSCAPAELVEAGGVRLGVLAINSALFCEDDNDHAKLWVGRRSLDAELRALQDLGADARVALIHHPLDWLADEERTQVRALLADGVDVVLRGHLHETDVSHVASPQGGLVHLAAGAAYQTRRWPNRALYVTLGNGALDIFPIRFEDSPRPVWTVDPSVFPDEPDYTARMPLRSAAVSAGAAAAAPDPVEPPPPATRFRSNVPSRRGLAFVGRERELRDLAARLDVTRGGERVVVVSGPPGVGKSELAREFARVHQDRYPGGTFFIDATGDAAPVDLARVAVNFLGVEFADGLPLDDQCEQALSALAAAPALLIYDNVGSFEAIERWLPLAGMPCHVIITSVAEPREPGWSPLLIEPLRRDESVRLVQVLAGETIAQTYGDQLATAAGGLPVQLCPAAATLAYEQRRGRTPDVTLIADETRTSFSGVYARLGASERLLLHAAIGLNPQRISQTELAAHLEEAAGWSDREFADAVDACLDLHLLQGDQHLTMHQLLAAFLRSQTVEDDLGEPLTAVRAVQYAALLNLAAQVAATPNDGSLAARLLGYALAPHAWQATGAPSAGELSIIGAALLEIGQFEQARPWFEQATEAKRGGGMDGRIDHESLGFGLHQVGYCYVSLGEFELARPWFEQAVEAARLGDLHGRVDHDSLGASLHTVGACFSGLREFEQARPWFEQAVEEKRRGDVDGRVDHVSLGASLHQVGYCYSSTGQFERARPWFDQAVEEARHADTKGRVDHANLGRSLHQVGFCHSSTGKFEQALPWFERAVEEKRQGDVHGRIDHVSLGVSLHQVGVCHMGLGEFERAGPSYEQAVEETRQGDVHGRVNSAHLRASLRSAAECLRKLGRPDRAATYQAEADSLDVPGS